MSDISYYQKKIEDLEKLLQNKNMEIARYRSELVNANERLEKLMFDLKTELKLAHLVQKKLSPTQLPHIQGVEFSTKFIPGFKTGGDYFDIFELEDKLKFGIIVAGCSGYSLSALFLSILIKLSSQIEAKKALDPGEVIDKIVAELRPVMQEKDSASLFYGIVDRRNFDFKFASVGSIGGLLQTEQRLIRLEPGPEKITTKYTAQTLSQSISLGAQDRLILCTEGVLQAKNKQKQNFGFEQLTAVIQRAARNGVHELRNDLIFGLEQFTETAEPERDQTVVVCEIKDKVLKLAKK